MSIENADDARDAIQGVASSADSALTDEELETLDEVTDFIYSLEIEIERLEKSESLTDRRLSDLAGKSYHVLGDVGRGTTVDDPQRLAEDLNHAGLALIAEIDNNDEEPYYMVASAEEVA